MSNAQRLAAQFGAQKQIPLAARPFGARLKARHQGNLARQREHQGNRKLTDGNGVNAARRGDAHITLPDGMILQMVDARAV